MRFVARDALTACLMVWLSSAALGQQAETAPTPTGRVVVVTPNVTAAQFREILNSASPNTTVILEDGTYDYHNIRVRHMKGVTIAARNAGQAISQTFDVGCGSRYLCRTLGSFGRESDG